MSGDICGFVSLKVLEKLSMDILDAMQILGSKQCSNFTQSIGFSSTHFI